MATTYEQFLAEKAVSAPPSGFHVRHDALGAHLFGFQRDIVLWALARRRTRAQMSALVGNRSGHDEPWVRSSEAYDLAYHTLYALLPDCDHEPSFFCVPAL